MIVQAGRAGRKHDRITETLFAELDSLEERGRAGRGLHGVASEEFGLGPHNETCST